MEKATATVLRQLLGFVGIIIRQAHSGTVESATLIETSSRLALDRETFSEMSKRNPEVAPIPELRVTLAQLRNEKTAVGADARNRCLLSPFRSRTGRSQPGGEFIFAGGMAIWYRSGLERSSRVRLPASLLRDFGVGRYSGYRALRALESAGLVLVVRHRGRCPVVEIIPQNGSALGGPDRNNLAPGITSGIARSNSGGCSGKERRI